MTKTLYFAEDYYDRHVIRRIIIEKYACEKNHLTGDVLREWDEKGITQEIYDGYWQCHQEAIQNAFADIESLAATGRHAIQADGV